MASWSKDVSRIKPYVTILRSLCGELRYGFTRRTGGLGCSSLENLHDLVTCSVQTASYVQPWKTSSPTAHFSLISLIVLGAQGWTDGRTDGTESDIHNELDGTASYSADWLAE